jgi:hypothetical protein
MSARQSQRRGTVYLIHFAMRYRHAGHYLGWSRCLDQRLSHHRAGHGARLMAAVSAAGIPFEVARVWSGADRAFERWLHNLKCGPRLCPVCAGDQAMRRARHATERPANSRELT